MPSQVKLNYSFSLGKIKHHLQKFGLGETNYAITMQREGEIMGRAVIMPEKFIMKYYTNGRKINLAISSTQIQI